MSQITVECVRCKVDRLERPYVETISLRNIQFEKTSGPRECSGQGVRGIIDHHSDLGALCVHTGDDHNIFEVKSNGRPVGRFTVCDELVVYSS